METSLLQPQMKIHLKEERMEEKELEQEEKTLILMKKKIKKCEEKSQFLKKVMELFFLCTDGI
jgi:hypothetical protein